MKRMAMLLVLAVLCLEPGLASAGSLSWSTPWTSGSISGESTSSGSTSGSVDVGATTVDWSASLDRAAKTISASATVNGQDYSGSLDWTDFFSWLFG